MSIRALELREGAPAETRLDLTDMDARALSASELAVVSRQPGAPAWSVSAGRKVGVARVGADLQVVVHPKITVDRVFFLMAYARDPAFWRDHAVELEREDSLPQMLADAFLRFSVRATERGLLQGYRTMDKSLPVMRGRLRVGDQMQARRPRPLPLEVTYDDFTVDIPENRLLLAATSRLLSIPGIGGITRSGLRRLRVALADVEPQVARPSWHPSRLNRHYHRALALAELILDASSVEKPAHAAPVSVTGFVVDMWKVFEDFVTVALREEFERRGGRAELQYATHLDRGHRVPMQPDFAWRNSLGVQVIADAKYKDESSESFRNADLYQMLAYCTALGRRRGHLIYARGWAEERTVAVERSPIVIHCHTLDLSATPAELLDQVADLVDKMLVPAWRRDRTTDGLTPGCGVAASSPRR